MRRNAFVAARTSRLHYLYFNVIRGGWLFAGSIVTTRLPFTYSYIVSWELWRHGKGSCERVTGIQRILASRIRARGTLTETNRNRSAWRIEFDTSHRTSGKRISDRTHGEHACFEIRPIKVDLSTEFLVSKRVPSRSPGINVTQEEDKSRIRRAERNPSMKHRLLYQSSMALLTFLLRNV